ncbi:MAG TPA: hypothetical protein VFQ61_20040 [Polyangiaceae bacterium]|nr:hypothetical protein [Polyangiaceae bacterium]
MTSLLGAPTVPTLALFLPTILLGAVLACGAGSSSHPAKPLGAPEVVHGVASSSAGKPRAPGASPAESATVPESAGSSTPSEPATPAEKTTVELAVRSWHCFSWVHRRDFATQCYETRDECTAAYRKSPHRDKVACEVKSGVVSCWEPKAAPGAPPPERICIWERETH